MARAASTLPEWAFLRSSSGPSASIRRFAFTRSCRKYHTNLATEPVSTSPDDFLDSRQRVSGMNMGSMAIKSGGVDALHPLQELERRVQALEEAIEAEESESTPTTYSEEDLMSIYEDVMAVPLPEATPKNDDMTMVQQVEDQEDLKIIDLLQQRLLEEPPAESSQMDHNIEPVYRRILARAYEISSRIEARANSAGATTTNRLPVSVLSIREFEALLRQTLKGPDIRASAIVLKLMKQSNLPLSAEHLTTFLRMYAKAGDTEAADDLLVSFLKDTPTEEHRHLHIQAHVNAAPRDEIPTEALTLLHGYEAQNLPPPMETYCFVIGALLSRPLSVARAQAWDLFAHMRYVAHPDPDVALYTQMIRACAKPVSVRWSSEPEKALDLFTEMTQDRKLEPTTETYNAVILACACSGEEMYVNEAFRLARQMLDSHRDARGRSEFKPDRKTFCALLEGTKRTANLSRARWILAEMLTLDQDADPNAAEAEIDEEVMVHIFNAYASYKPPTIKAASDSTSQKFPNQQRAGSPMKYSRPEPTTAPAAHTVPQSHGEVISEVKILMAHIRRSQPGIRPDGTRTTPSLDHKFRGVQITPHLVGAYISVFYKHASLATSRELFWSLFEDLGITRTARIYVEALERCASARRGPERQEAVAFAEELWEQWKTLEDMAIEGGRPLRARMVERAHIARINTYTRAEQVDEALQHVRVFAKKYPCEDILQPPPKPVFRATRTSLVGGRPLVRMASPTEVPDDYVPPVLTFRDLKNLHNILVVFTRPRDIEFLTYVTNMYQGALRTRRHRAMKATPPKEATSPIPLLQKFEQNKSARVEAAEEGEEEVAVVLQSDISHLLGSDEFRGELEDVVEDSRI